MPGTYSRFLHRFQPYGLGRHSFVVAYGLAEHTLAVSSYGRTALSVSRDALARGCARVVTAASEITSARQIMSCGPPLGDTRVRIVDPDTHTVVEDGQVGEVWYTDEASVVATGIHPSSLATPFTRTLLAKARRARAIFAPEIWGSRIAASSLYADA